MGMLNFYEKKIIAKNQNLAVKLKQIYIFSKSGE